MFDFIALSRSMITAHIFSNENTPVTQIFFCGMMAKGTKLKNEEQIELDFVIDKPISRKNLLNVLWKARMI